MSTNQHDQDAGLVCLNNLVTMYSLPSVAMESLPPSNLTESATNTHMVMQWGQFVDHDIIGTAKSAFDCCNPDIK